MTEPHDAVLDAVCYRHPDRATGVSCQRCERPICAQCMHQASVGVHCPECTSQAAQRVYTTANLPGANAIVTKALIAINVAVFLVGNAIGFSRVSNELLVSAPLIDVDNEWWRIITGGFAHGGVLHLAMNMYALWALGRMLEIRLGPPLFLTAYVASLLGGSFLSLLMDPLTRVLGASGAIFGLLGLLVMALRDRGIGLKESGLGSVLLINLFISFLPFVSLWGHLGGFVIGIVLGALYFGINPGDDPLIAPKTHLPVTVVLALGTFAASVWAATTWMSPIF